MKSESPSPGAAAIDDDVAALIDAAIEAPPVEPSVQERIKQRLLRRIAADATPQHLTLEADQGTWQPFASGVQIKVLHESGGVMSYLLRLQAGAVLPAHRHPIDEECVVLEGRIRIGSSSFGTGAFHLGRKNVLHDCLASDEGALIFLRGAAPEIAHLI